MTRENEPSRAAHPAPRAAHEPSASSFGSIQNTSWSIVRSAGDGAHPERSAQALRELAERYRAPVRAFIAHEGYSDGETDSLTARFLRTLEQPGVLAAAAAGGGRFREWLLGAVHDFLGRVDADGEPERASDAHAAAVESRGGEAGAREVASAAKLFGDSAMCPKCGRWTGELDGRGACSACVAAPTVQSFAGYQIVEAIGRGGEAVVYRAWDPRAERQVALKVLRHEHLDSPELVQRFRKAVELAGRLEHPNIVRVYERGGAAGELPFYTMPLVPGGTLADRQRQERFRDPVRAARVMIKIARAVHHAHQRGVLHRDLSPANVLLGLDDEPYVSDFMAKRIEQGGAPSVVGALNYMAPEQALGKGGTVEADVYGLGAIFYELLTGRPPVSARDFDEVRAKHEADETPAPRALVPHLHPDLDAICSAALQRDPALRHRSAALFADSLERVLEKHPPLWPLVSRRRRLVSWASRHPLLAAGALLGTLLLVLADIALLGSVRSEERELQTAVLHSNAALASAQARAVLALFEKHAAQTARAASEAEVREFLLRGEMMESSALLARILQQAPNFDSASLFSPDGQILARHPHAQPGFIGRYFDFRQYYSCVRALAARWSGPGQGRAPIEPEVCISPAYRGESSLGIEFSFAAPVHDDSGEWLGFVLMNKHARHTLDEIDIGDVYRSGQTTALFSRRDRDRDSPDDDASTVGDLTVVAHPDQFGAEEHVLDRGLSALLGERFGADGAPGQQLRSVRVRPYERADYVDPVTGDPRLVGFAPVGATGFVVAVSTPRERALGTSQRHVEALWKYAGLLNLGFAILTVVAVGGSLRDNRPRRANDAGASRRRSRR
jgi:eukaryotic-like serine/threonine-protein kinase